MAITDFLERAGQKISGALGMGNGIGAKQDDPYRERDGNDPPKDGLTENQRKYGPNYEQLKEKNPRIVAALEKIVMEYRLEALYAQRAKIRRIQYARLFWQEIQYAYWNEGRGVFDYNGQNGVASDWGAGSESPIGQRYEYVTNFYQAFGLNFCALLSQDVPTKNILPKSRDVQEDITAAKAARDIAEVIEANNDPHESLQTAARYFWTDGVCFSYWRYVVDGERFGWKMLPNIGLRAVDGMMLPEDQGQEKIPLGQEVVSYLGGLEVAVPIYASEFHDFGWLQWSSEPDIAQLKDAYPHAADGIQADSGLSAEQVFERLARLGIKQNIPWSVPADGLASLPTFQRTWIRRWAFNRIEDKKLVAELKELFPDGAYTAFAGFEYCESRSESMDDHWKMRYALPGDGQSRPAVGQSLISVQERYNALSNMYQENAEYGIPPIYADPQVLDFDALANQASEPAVHYPARARPGQALANSFFQPDPGKIDVSIPAVMNSLMGEVAQFLSGMPPAIWGGQMDAQQTASGYAMARDQAMGRIGMVWRSLKEFYVAGIGLGIEIFKKNRSEDIEVPFVGENDEQETKWIRLVDLKGNLMVRSEPDEGLPVQNSAQRAVLVALLEMGPAMPAQLAKALADPNNVGWVKTVLGLGDMTMPNENAALLAMRLIQQLVATGPVEFPPQPAPQVNPQTGQTVFVMVPAPPQPTLQVDPLLAMDPEFVAAMLAKFVEWAGDDEGQTQAKQNPKGYLNVYLFAKQLSQIVQNAAAQKAQETMLMKHGEPKAQLPSMSVATDKMTPNVQAQILAKDGIQADPMEIQQQQDQQRQDKAHELQARLSARPAQESNVNG